ncbi:hypothetical protein QZH41_014030 [Actinostola sp. cb2023]|nr:hypothetical protein QZH41_014030 [Actinostola sp. cb2023]
MAVEEWFLQEEGCLQFNGRPTSISYSPTSHCFIATLEDGSIEVLDVSSGRTLKRTFLEGTSLGSNSNKFGSLECRFCPGVEKLFVTDHCRTVGLRKDLNGVLLLDSILQAPVAEDCDAPITLELTLADAKQLQTGIESCIPTVVPPVLDVMETLKEQLKVEINQHQPSSAIGSKSSVPSNVSSALSSDESDKAAKWNTCKLRLPSGALLCAFDGMVTSLHKNHRTSAALPIASAMLARVMALTGTSVLEKKGQPVYKQLMFVEAARRQTFSTWPHTNYKWAYPEAMAHAGFYHQPACTGDDRAMCFTCSVCLVCWEPTDEPWSEHERHSAECPFVRGERTENVPMCVSLATTPAKHHGQSRKAKITSISSSSCPCLMATSSDTGHIVVWDLSDQLKVYSQFMVESEEKDEWNTSNKDLSLVPQAWPHTLDNEQPIIFDPIHQETEDIIDHLHDDDSSTEHTQHHDGDKAPEVDKDEDQTQPQDKDESVSAETNSTTADVMADSDAQHEVIEVSCEFNDDDGSEPSPIVEEPEESSEGIVEEPNTMEAKLHDEKSISLTEEGTIQSLLKLLQKTEFENLVPRFTAIVPPSWSEVQQEQQQRQHPQHLHQQSLGDATLHTRTWKLQPEGKSNANGEQIFELLLPKQCHVGHVDIKFSLNNSNNPSINVYLLKPWSLKSWQEDYSSKTSSKKVPILSAAKENGHILCGPVELQKGSHPRVALTCPDLVKTRHRILLLVFESSQSPFPLEEISVTVRRFKFSPQSSCFMQYPVMLEEPAFHRRLVEIVCNPGHEKILTEELRKLALDLLCWMAGICVHTPIRKNSLIHQIQSRLHEIIPVCFLQSGRTVAHQCSVLLLLCARQSTWDKKYGISKTEQSFRASLLKALLQVLPDALNAVSAGALHCLFSLLVGYAALVDVKQTSSVCQELLTEVSTKMDSLMLHSHTMLQGSGRARWEYIWLKVMQYGMSTARYGLYGLPFEPVLFDLTLPHKPPSPTPKTPVPLSTTSSYPVQMIYQSHVKSYLGPGGPREPATTVNSAKPSTGLIRATVTSTSMINGKYVVGLQDLECTTDSTQYISKLVAHQGLLEVEPLHFTCTSTSDGARVERAESPHVVPGLPSAATATGQSLSSMLPTVSVSTEPDIEFLKQHYQQLAKIQLQQHKQVLEKHKQELEELAMWSLFPKMLSKLEGEVPGGGDAWFNPVGTQPYSHYHSGVSVNLSQQKKLTSRRTSSKKGLPSLTPIHKQHSQLPLPQALIIERLHSGARHHVVLDFGTAMELTDIIIPSRSDLSSLSIDVWFEGEEKDAQRIAIVSDIGSCDCVLKDLHPPPVCQFVKLTVVGRPRSNSRVKMKIGEFYGRPHTPSIMDIHEGPEHRLHMLESLYEEVHCHYSLACGKLESLLENTSDENKLETIYQQCIDLQLQLNFVHHSISRLQAHQPYKTQNEAGYDQMRVLCTCLAETVVGLMAISPDEKGFLAKTNVPVEPQIINCSLLTWDLCDVLFRNLCIHGNPVLRVRVAALLLHTSGTQPWWGNFLAQVLQQFFSSSQHMVFPKERVFVVLSVLAQQSPDVALVLTSLLSLLDYVLSGTSKKGSIDIQEIDISLVGWIVLLLAHILNTCGVGKTQATASGEVQYVLICYSVATSESSSNGSTSTTTTSSKTANSVPSDKWDFIVPSPTTQTTQPTSNLTGYRHRHHKLRTKISKHEKHLLELQKQQKKMMEIQGSESLDVQNIEQAYVKSKITSQALKQHIKDLVKLRHQEAESSSSKGKKSSSSKSKSSKKTGIAPTSVPMLLSERTTVPVMKKMMQLVLTMNSSCSVDLVLTICKVVALLSSISQPTVLVTDILSDCQVESILRLCVSCWGGPWTRHALITLLQDLMHGFKSDAQAPPEEEEEEKSEMESVSHVENKDQASDASSAPGLQEIWSMVQNVPMEWNDPFIPGPVEFPGDDSLLPVPCPPTPEDVCPVIPPRPPTNSETTASSAKPMVKVSCALDARLELGVTMESEWDLKTLQLIQTDAVLRGMATVHPQRYHGYKMTKKQASSSLTSIVEVFSKCFDKLFSECHDSKLDLGCLLELWLRLNGVLPGSSDKTPMFIPLSKTSLANLLSFLANCPTISLQKLYLAFEVMRSVVEKTSAITGPSEGKCNFSLTEAFVGNPDLVRVLEKTLVEGSPKDYGAETGVGTTGTGIKQVEVFLSSIAVALEKQEQGRLLGKFHSLMLDLLCTLAAENVHSSGRSLQVKPILRAFLKHPPASTKELDVSLIIELLQLTMELSLQHLRKKDEISLRASSHFHETPRLTTSSHFLEGKALNEPWIVHSTWLTKLLSLIIMLLQIPAEKPPKDVEDPSSEKHSEHGPKSEQLEEGAQGDGSEGSRLHDTTDSKAPSDMMDDACDSMVKTLQAMAKAVEKNASQTTDEAQPIINVIEEESSSSTSETETSGGEEEESLLAAETGGLDGLAGEDDNRGSVEKKEEAATSTAETDGAQTSQDTPSSPRPCKSVLPDQIISAEEICLNLLQCLNLCSSNNIGVLLTGANILNSSQSVPVSGEPVSVEDGILQVMSVIFSQLTHKDLLVSIVIKYLSGQGKPGSNPINRVSEPFLWFLLRMLDSNKQVAVFSAQGGYELLFNNLVASYNVDLDDKTQDLIPVMRQLTKLAHNSSNGSAKLLLNAVWEAEKDNGMVNYAPFGSISCTRPSAHPADALLKACAPHRRARSAAWSYHFYPGELWCDLTIQLPTPILLHAVYVQPHTAGLTTCPSYVALDYSVDGTVMIPASKPVMTSGLSVIKLQFEQPQIAQRVCIRCRRPRDSESLGLSQIKVWGTSLYGPPAENLVSSIQSTRSNCLNWICLLDHCLHRSSPDELITLSSSKLLHEVFGICISLLGSNQSELFSGCQEDVLHTLALEFSDLGQILLKKLLVNPGRVQSSQSVSVYSSSLQLIFKLAKSSGAAATQRLRIIAEWLTSLSSQAHISTSTDNAMTGLVQAVAAVLWTTADSDLARIVQDEFKVSLFRSIYEWSQLVGRQEPLKQAIDYLICSLCHVCPSYFQLLLHLTEAQSLVDQARTQDEQSIPSHPVFVYNRSCMATLSRASQSPITSYLLLASGVLNLLHDSTLRLCNTLLTSHGRTDPDDGGMHLSIECLSDVISFMASCTEEPVIKTWFGESGSDFWKPLMLLLGSGLLFSPIVRMTKQAPSLPTRHRIALESAVINFFCQCIACHPANQTLFAKLLCEVMSTPCGMFAVSSDHVSVNTRGVGLDGFLRRLLLEALLQDETIKVCIHYGSVMKPISSSQDKLFCHNRDWHPRFGAGYDVLMFKAKLASTVEELDEVVFPNASLNKATDGSASEDDIKATSKAGDFDELTALGDSEILEGLSIAAGINVKSKRARASTMLKKISSQKFDSSFLRPNPNSLVCRHHSVLGNVLIPTKVTLCSLANALMDKGLAIGTNCIEMSLKTCGGSTAHVSDESLLKTPPLTSALHKFASFDGLAILSSRLSCSVVMNQPSQEMNVDPGDVALPLAFPLPLFSLSASVLSRIPGHSLAAFGLFICLPGYSDVLLQDRPKAQCLLRLLLGAEDDGNGGHVLFSQVAGSLPTLPFQILRLLFHSKPLSNQDGVSLREVSLDQGAIQLVLMCLGVLSHHDPRVVSPTDRLALQTVAALTGNLLRGSDQANNSEKQYWAKGTGFGTGSTSSDWDIENAMKKQRAEEAHSTCMLQVLAGYIRPSGVQKLEDLTCPEYSPEYTNSDKIPLAMMELLARSCLVPTLSSYLRNDSVLDMARHVPLYQAVLEVMRALATCPSLVHLLTPDDNGDTSNGASTSLAALIDKMKKCVDTYSKTLRSTSQATRRSKRDKKLQPIKPPPPTPPQDEPEGDQDTKESDAEGLALLIPDIQATATLVHDMLSRLHDAEASKGDADGQGSDQTCLLKNVELSNEEKYLVIIKPLQFDMYEIVSEEDNDRLEFTISYHFASTLRSATSNGEMGSPARARRLAQEITSLSTSLPLSSSSSVFVRCDETRLDIMKVLITGPAETPYANGCFEFDVYFPHNYPNAPMQINFETTGHHTIRFNPNLYNDGKVCLSILNTWHGRPEEKWNPQTSSFLQVLVSTQSLILVAEPYFNEPGYERSRGTPAGKQNSQEYNANIRQATVKWGMLEQLRKPCKCFKEVMDSHFYLKKDEILQQCETWIREIEALTLRNSGGRAALHHLHSLRQHTAQLRVELDKLTPPNQLASKKNEP